MGKELKPCPFCGGQAIRLLDVDDYTSEEYDAIHCVKCKAKTKYYGSWQEAIEAWNRRVTDE